MSYRELRKFFDEEHNEVTGPSGSQYQIDTLAVWDNRPEGNLRLIVSIDDGRLPGAIVPITDGFIVSPDGSFVGE
jgi:hypothetical protein